MKNKDLVLGASWFVNFELQVTLTRVVAMWYTCK